MYTLVELKKVFEEHGHKINHWEGWRLIVGKNSYTILDNEYYVNGVIIKRKDLLSTIKTKTIEASVDAKFKAKKINASRTK